MTIRDYISSKLAAFGVTEAVLADFVSSTSLDLDAEYSSENETAVGAGITSIVEQMMFAPRQASISEGGFSVSYNFDNLAKYYLWLCQKYGITPNAELVAQLGLSVITDKSYLW